SSSLQFSCLCVLPSSAPLSFRPRKLVQASVTQKCGERCAKAGVQERCLKYCGICCEKCQCVPSGTYGNKHECACYRDLKNSKGKSKCP
ncbi:hypothetical protein I3760_16G034400, partial [Carya illinoinensis]